MDASLKILNISCLQEHEEILQNELEPLLLCDVLFEEGALDILDHDKVTDKKNIQKQIKQFINIVKEDRNNCFCIFLCILQEMKYDCILRELKGSAQEVVDKGMF